MKYSEPFASWSKNSWHIVDPRPWYLKNPETFYLAPADELNELQIGVPVKLWFQSVLSEGGGERLWVIITSINGNRLSGTVDNGPHQVPLSFGDVINFRRHHIMGIEWEACANTSEEVKETLRIMGMFDHLRREPTMSERLIMAHRITDYLVSRDQILKLGSK